MAAKKVAKKSTKTAARVANKAAKKVARKAEKKSRRKSSALDEVIARIDVATSVQQAENPNEPVANRLASGGRIAALARKERARLTRLSSFDVIHLDHLPLALKLLEEREAEWNSVRASRRAGVSPKKLKEGEALRSETVAAGRYLLRQDAKAQQELDQIMEGTGTPDLVEDLGTLAAFVARHQALFATDDTLPAKLEEKLRASSETLSVGIDPADAAEAQQKRNNAFVYATLCLNEVRAALTYLWRKQPAKLALLGVTYAAQLQRNSRKRRAKKVIEAPQP